MLGGIWEGETAVYAAPTLLENQFLRATLKEQGELRSLWNKTVDRELLRDGAVGNRFQPYEDKPGKYDVWNIVASYVELNCR